MWPDLFDLCLLKVKPPGRENDSVNDMRSLSGGERSFSTVCFILSLWEITESPFRCLDEFDVYMVRHCLLYFKVWPVYTFMLGLMLLFIDKLLINVFIWQAVHLNYLLWKMQLAYQLNYGFIFCHISITLLCSYGLICNATFG